MSLDASKETLKTFDLISEELIETHPWLYGTFRHPYIVSKTFYVLAHALCVIIPGIVFWVAIMFYGPSRWLLLLLVLMVTPSTVILHKYKDPWKFIGFFLYWKPVRWFLFTRSPMLFGPEDVAIFLDAIGKSSSHRRIFSRTKIATLFLKAEEVKIRQAYIISILGAPDPHASHHIFPSATSRAPTSFRFSHRPNTEVLPPECLRTLCQNIQYIVH